MVFDPTLLSHLNILNTIVANEYLLEVILEWTEVSLIIILDDELNNC